MTGDRVPEDAFAYYASLGPDRSYARVADHFGVSLASVQKAAQRGEWRRRLDRILEESREKIDQKVTESIETMNERHLRMLHAIQGKAVEALSRLRIETPEVAIRAILDAVKLERVVRGEPEAIIGVEGFVRKMWAEWMDTKEVRVDAESLPAALYARLQQAANADVEDVEFEEKEESGGGNGRG